ncbi:unnamed protein product [Moneuplotes crassus]|uniref:Uncharacterized protein n=1 Tax=Euplotes crassus TaxID=5936 RepID=A0AAD1UGX0_EUPCR|nr:unnamed protein product [Moneuplotes crassus]
MESLRAIELEIYNQEKLYHDAPNSHMKNGILSRHLGYSLEKLYEGQCGMRSKKEIRNFGSDQLTAHFNMHNFMKDRSWYPGTHLQWMERKYYHELEISHRDFYRWEDILELQKKNSIPRRGIINICRMARFITVMSIIQVPQIPAKDINVIFHAFHHLQEVWLLVRNVPGAITDFRIDPSVEFKISRILQDGMETKDHWLSAIIQSPSIRKNLRRYGGYYQGENDKLEKILSEWDSNISIERR